MSHISPARTATLACRPHLQFQGVGRRWRSHCSARDLNYLNTPALSSTNRRLPLHPPSPPPHPISTLYHCLVKPSRIMPSRMSFMSFTMSYQRWARRLRRTQHILFNRKLQENHANETCFYYNYYCPCTRYSRDLDFLTEAVF